MKLFTTRDNRRMTQSTLASLAIHIVVFVALSIFIAVNGVKSQDRLGTLTLNLESGSRPARRPAQDKVEEEEKVPQPSPSVKPKQPEPVNPSPRPVAKTKPAQTKTAAAKTTNATTTAKATTSQKKDPAPATSPVPKSNLETGSLSQLDAMLKESETKKTTTTNGSGGSGGGGSSGNSPAATRWDDNAVRELISQTAPVIPKWVSEQGLRLKVELNVELNTDGLVIVRGVRNSSGYPDVDAAVAKAVSRWKYTRGSGARSVKGVITYFITPR